MSICLLRWEQVSGLSEQKPKCTGPSEGDRVCSTYVRDQVNGTKCTGTRCTRPSWRQNKVYKTKCTRTRVYCEGPRVWDQVNGTKCMGPSVRNKSISISFLKDKTGKISLKALPPRLKCFPSLFPKESFLSDLERTVLGGTRCRLGCGLHDSAQKNY